MRRRFEGKGTYSPYTGHSVRVAYLNNYTRAENENFLGNELDLASLTNREDPENTWSFNYNAVLRPNLFFEAQYSQQQWFTRNSTIGSSSNAVWNQTFVGVQGAPVWENYRRDVDTHPVPYPIPTAVNVGVDEVQYSNVRMGQSAQRKQFSLALLMLMS